MKTETNGNFSSVLLTGTLLLANVNVSGLLDYGLKALIGGGIWLGFKLAADYIERQKQKSTGK